MSHTELPADLTLPYKACLSAFTPYLTHAHLRALVEPLHSVVDPRNRPIDQYLCDEIKITIRKQTI